MGTSEPYVFEPHKPEKRRNISYPVCRKCGLVYLKNAFTDWSIARGCNSEDHPSFDAKRKLAGTPL
jgi:hypothetical protein